MTGVVFNIQRFSLHDGPGIRTTVFLKGCSLDCVWCHNPESKKAFPQLSFFGARCIGCGACECACGHGVFERNESGRILHYDRCTACGKCLEACPTMALEILGREMAVDEVLEKVVRDQPFYRTSGGGMTVSGGEPAMQPEFVSELLRGAKNQGIHTAMETAAHVPWNILEELIPVLDLVLLDIKQMDAQKHRAYTGKSNERILDNLRRLCSKNQMAEVIVRTPVIPGFNDDAANFQALAAFLHTMERQVRVEILPYNPLAGSKYPRIGMEYPLDTDESKGTAPEELCEILKANSVDARVVR